MPENPVTTSGTLEVYVTDSELWGLPYQRIEAARRLRTDNGIQISSGDLLKHARFDSAVTLLCTSIISLREQLYGMDLADPRRP